MLLAIKDFQNSYLKELNKVKNYKNIIIFSAALYLILGTLSNLLGWKAEDANWNIQAAKRVAVFDTYSEFRLKSVAPPDGAPIGYTPFLLIVTYFFVLAGVPGYYTIFLFLADILNVLLISDFILRINPSNKKFIPAISLILFFSGFFLYSSGFIGHPETLVIAFSLMSLRFLFIKKKTAVAGILAGFALASKQSAIFFLIPLLTYLLLIKKDRKEAAKFALGTLASFSLIILPFLLNNFQSTVYGLYGYTNNLIIRGPNLWWFVDSFLSKVLKINGGPLFFKIANIFVVLISVALSVYMVTNRKNLDLSKFFGLIALNFFVYTIFGKWTSFHYFLLNFAFLLLWEATRKKGFPYIWLAYSLLITSANFIGNPLWQFETLAINIFTALYLIRAL